MEDSSMTLRVPTHREPEHPGIILLEEFIRPYGLTITRAAELLKMNRQRLDAVVNGRRSVTPDTALRLERLFGSSAGFWLNLQQVYDLWHAMHAAGVQDLDAIPRLASIA
jgi:addiction module HigA family antidote